MAFVEKRKRGTWVGFIIDMHAQESTTSWMRWMGTLILTNHNADVDADMLI